MCLKSRQKNINLKAKDDFWCFFRREAQRFSSVTGRWWVSNGNFQTGSCKMGRWDWFVFRYHQINVLDIWLIPNSQLVIKYLCVISYFYSHSNDEVLIRATYFTFLEILKVFKNKWNAIKLFPLLVLLWFLLNSHATYQKNHILHLCS